MINKYINLLFICSLTYINSYLLPQTFREWHVIGIDSKIDKSIPYKFNIGKLPMILWHDKDNLPISTFNICKHLGNKLDNSKISNGCLVCPSHELKYTNNDSIGSTVSNDGLIWWSYKSNKKNPPNLPLRNSNYKTTHFKLDINVDLISCVLNFLDVKDVNSKIIFKNNKLLLKIVKEDYTSTIFYKYPYTIFISTKINAHKLKAVYFLNLLPLEENKTRLFVTIKYNDNLKEYTGSWFYCFIIKFFLFKVKHKLENEYTNDNLKKYLMLQNTMGNNYLSNVYKLYENYMFPNDFTIYHFMKNKQYY
jgi:nitrite reductase/ring-hydroxylating ferredoxin subunit